MTNTSVQNGNGALIEFLAEETDAEGFVKCVGSVARGLCRIHAPAELIVVRIDNWFDHKWVGFSGKILGALGVWKKTLTIPPFVPGRVCWQRRYQRVSSSESYELTDPGPSLHITDKSTPKLRREVSKIAPKTVLLWFSSNTEPNKKGAVMAYVPTENDYWAWYVGLGGNGEWKPRALHGITLQAFQHLEFSGKY